MRFQAAYLLAAAGVGGCAAIGLLDAPLLTGATPQYLDGNAWTTSNGAVTIGAVVPGDLITDLQR